jgi:DNA-directed RNA polymerase specialized sigma24 family protein
MMKLPLENLTPRQRQAYILRFRRGWRLRWIAAKLGIAVSSAGERQHSGSTPYIGFR